MKKYSHLLRESQDYRSDLKRLLGEDFQFLEFGFDMTRTEISDGYRYSNASSTVYVRLPEREAPWVGVDRNSSPFGAPDLGLPVWAAMNVQKSQYLYNDADAAIDKFPLYSLALRECCEGMLRGDFSDANAIVSWIQVRQDGLKAWESLNIWKD
jgi:hypothetical protein